MDCSALFPRSAYAVILDKLYENAFEIYITNDILLEYEEKISDIFSSETVEPIVGAFALLPNVRKVDIHFHLNLITADPDDNKFSDCAFAGNVHFLVTDEKHLVILKSTPFPSINVITLDQFKELLVGK
jgi:putative PIN family toxin of toxin-antitoxin system